jgi:hypothetical protein
MSMTSTEASQCRDCHILPCSIEYTGVLPDDDRLKYFQPHPLPSDDENEIFAAQFRGRGLLSKPVPTTGQVLLIKDKKIQSITSFDRVFEWQHLHQPAALASASSRVSHAKEWFDVASALHAPVETKK